MKRVGAEDFGAVLIALIAVIYLYIDRSYPLWGDYTFSAGFYPLILGLLLLILSFIWFLSNRKLEIKKAWRELFPDRGTMTVILMLILATTLFNFLGAFLYLALLTGSIWFLYEKFSLRFSIFASLILSGTMYIIFRYGLSVSLPKGLLPF